MSTANMWSDDSDADASSSIQHHPTADPPHADMSSMAQGPWIHFTANIENDDTRPTEMEFDEDPVHSTADTAAWQPFLGHDEDDDLLIGDEEDGGGGAHLNILDVTNILSQGMSSDQDLDLSEDEALTSNFLSHHQLIEPMSYPPVPAPTALPTNGLPTIHLPAPPTWGLPPILAPLPGQGAAMGAALNAHEASLFHLHQHLPPLPHHPQNLNPNAASNPHATALGPENYDLDAFVRFWAFQYVTAWRGSPRDTRYPWPKRIEPQMSKSVSQVAYEDLEGDKRDVQGFNWEDLGVTRSDARERRSLTYKNYVNIAGSDRWQVSAKWLARTQRATVQKGEIPLRENDANCSPGEPRRSPMHRELLQIPASGCSQERQSRPLPAPQRAGFDLTKPSVLPWHELSPRVQPAYRKGQIGHAVKRKPAFPGLNLGRSSWRFSGWWIFRRILLPANVARMQRRRA